MEHLALIRKVKAHPQHSGHAMNQRVPMLPVNLGIAPHVYLAYPLPTAVAIYQSLAENVCLNLSGSSLRYAKRIVGAPFG
jgi:hypothetical protein